jgi:hypothetical protein
MRGGDDVLRWKIAGEGGECEPVGVSQSFSYEVGRISATLSPGEYVLEAWFGDVSARWPICVVKKPAWESLHGWCKYDPFRAFDDVALPSGDNVLTTLLEHHHLDGRRVVAVLEHEGTVPMPFWRECGQEFAPGLLDPWANRWDRLWAVAPDRALDPDWLHQTVGDYEVLMNRVDTRTYKEHPYVVRAGNVTVTTLRPQGGHGAQPYGVKNNPSGAALLAALLRE